MCVFHDGLGKGAEIKEQEAEQAVFGSRPGAVNPEILSLNLICFLSLFVLFLGFLSLLSFLFILSLL